MLAVAAAANVTIWGAPAPVLADDRLASLALVAALRFVNPLDGPLGEEPGWRGYALPRAAARRSPLGRGPRARPARGALAPAAGVDRAARRRRPPHHVRHHAGLRLAVQPHRRQRPADDGVPHRAGHVQLRRARLRRRRRRPDGLARRRAVVRPRPRRGRARPAGVAGGPRPPSRHGRAAGRTADRRSGRVPGSAPVSGAGPASRAVYSHRRRTAAATGGPSRRRRDDGGRHGRPGPGPRQLRARRPASARSHVRGVWLALWAAAAVASWPCCARAARRRPGESDRRRPAPGRRFLRRVRPGRVAAPAGQPQRPAHDGHRVRLSPLRSAREVDTLARAHGRELAPRPLDAVLRPAGAHLLHGRPAAHRADRVLRRRRPRRDRACSPRSGWSSPTTPPRSC